MNASYYCFEPDTVAFLVTCNHVSGVGVYALLEVGRKMCLLTQVKSIASQRL